MRTVFFLLIFLTTGFYSTTAQVKRYYIVQKNGICHLRSGKGKKDPGIGRPIYLPVKKLSVAKGGSIAIMDHRGVIVRFKEGDYDSDKFEKMFVFDLNKKQEYQANLKYLTYTRELYSSSTVGEQDSSNWEKMMHDMGRSVNPWYGAGTKERFKKRFIVLDSKGSPELYKEDRKQVFEKGAYTQLYIDKVVLSGNETILLLRNDGKLIELNGEGEYEQQLNVPAEVWEQKTFESFLKLLPSRSARESSLAHTDKDILLNYLLYRHHNDHDYSASKFPNDVRLLVTSCGMDSWEVYEAPFYFWTYSNKYSLQIRDLEENLIVSTQLDNSPLEFIVPELHPSESYLLSIQNTMEQERLYKSTVLKRVEESHLRELDKVKSRFEANSSGALGLVSLALYYHSEGLHLDAFHCFMQALETADNQSFVNSLFLAFAHMNILSESEGGVLRKPVIYLYPEKKDTIHVKVNFNGVFIETIPDYPENGWTVVSSTDSEIYDLGSDSTYPYLFWEGNLNSLRELINDTMGFVVSGRKTEFFLKGRLREIGLTDSEIQEFCEYWCPYLIKNEFNYIHFLINEKCNEFATIETNPAFNSSIRVLMIYEPCTRTRKCHPQRFTRSFRNGFTIVEWGGALLNEKN